MSYILIVDDDQDLTTAISKVLKTEGYEVKVLSDTQSAQKSLQSRIPDLMILDVMFPEDAAAGFDFAREVRKDEAYNSMPVLMLTAVNEKYPFGFSSSDIDEQWLPVSEFLEKPVDFDVLKAKVAQLVQSQAQ